MGMTFDEFCDKHVERVWVSRFKEYCVYNIDNDIYDCLLTEIEWAKAWDRTVLSWRAK